MSWTPSRSSIGQSAKSFQTKYPTVVVQQRTNPVQLALLLASKIVMKNIQKMVDWWLMWLIKRRRLSVRISDQANSNLKGVAVPLIWGSHATVYSPLDHGLSLQCRDCQDLCEITPWALCIKQAAWCKCYLFIFRISMWTASNFSLIMIPQHNSWKGSVDYTGQCRGCTKILVQQKH